MFRSCLVAAALAAAAAPASRSPAEANAPACDTVATCVAALRQDVTSGHQVREPVRLRLASLGGPAVDALVPLLLDPSPAVRESAGLALTYFERVDPRHLPALVSAWRTGDAGRSRPGNGWLPRPIAATGTDEALRLLWADFEREPDMGSNAQTFFALAWGFGDRIRPLILARFAACRDSSDGAPCAGLYELLNELRPPNPAWSVEAIVEVAGHARSNAARVEAENSLAARQHPAALAPLQRRLAALPATAALGFDGRWDAKRLIRQIERYGAVASGSAAAILPYLGRAYDENLRADAALALGRIGARPAVPALLALAPDLADDWLLAYNVAESLGRLRAAEARPLLRQLADNYWHRGVRRNAARALGAIAGGPFADPAVRGDGAPYPEPRDADGEQIVYFGSLRFAGDDAANPCEGPDLGRRLARHPAGFVPRAARGVEAIRFAEIPGRAAGTLRRRIPSSVARGQVMFSLPVRGGVLVGLNGGEFGGGLVMLPDRGAARSLTGEPVAFAWRMGNRLYVAAGLAHLVLDTGHLYVVDPARQRIERTIRLPASPRRLFSTAGGAVVIGTEAGQLAVGADGQLVDVERLQGCTGG